MRIPRFACVLLASSQCSFAVFPFLVQTDSSGDFTAGNGSYSGDGIVQSDVVSNTYTDPVGSGGGLQQSLLIDNMTSGTLTVDTAVDNPLDSGLQRIITDLQATVSVTFVGGTGDLYVNNSAQWDGGNDKFNSFGLRDLDGVTSVTFRVSYDRYVAGRDTVTDTGNAEYMTSRPLLGALGLVDAGGSLALDQFNIDMSYDRVRFSNDGTVFTDSPLGTSVRSAGFDTVDGLNYSATGFAGEIIPGDTPTNTNFLIVRGFDVDGADSYDAGDAPKVYARDQTWTVTPRNGATEFEADTHLTFSMDGSQYSNIHVVPEASVSLLSLVGGLTALGYRRRKNG